jgi:hypothetical protein
MTGKKTCFISQIWRFLRDTMTSLPEVSTTSLRLFASGQEEALCVKLSAKRFAEITLSSLVRMSYSLSK